MKSKSVLPAALLLFACSSAYSSARANDAYDGQWSVQLVTVKGDCDRSLSWDVAVASSRIAENGLFGQAAGQVDSRGRVRLQVLSGADRVSATGALRGASGGGAWTWPNRACSGRWSASRKA